MSLKDFCGSKTIHFCHYHLKKNKQNESFLVSVLTQDPFRFA